MKKIQLILLLAATTIMFSCQQNKDSKSQNDADSEVVAEETSENNEVEDEVNDKVEIRDIDVSSIKFLLLGIWQDEDAADYKMEMTPGKFKNYLDGDINWNQDWGLANSSDTYEENIDDNGMFIWVLKDNGKYLYCGEIIVLNETTLELDHVFGGLSGSHEKYVRVN